jgi:hypothetical protein
MKGESSFSQKVKAGWTKEKLMAYYALNEREYEKVVSCLQKIKQFGERIS